MQGYRSIYIGPLIVLATLMPFFDWTEDLVSIGGFFYLNIYKLYFIITLGYIILQIKHVKAKEFYQVGMLIFLGIIFVLFHRNFDNLKGFFFVNSLLIIATLTKGISPLITPRNLFFLRTMIFVVLATAIIEVVIDKKFVTPDFRDNHRQFLGYDLRRASLSFQDPNYLAFHSGMMCLILRLFSRRNEGLMTLFTFIIICLTGSRGGLLAILSSLCFYQYYKYWRFSFNFLVYLSPLVLFLLLPKLSGIINEIPELYLEASVDIKTIMTRIILWTAALSTIVANPIFGLGHGRISDYGKTQYLPFDLPEDVNKIIDGMGFHNYWIELVVENGIVISSLLMYILWKKRTELKPLVIFLSVFLFTSGYESPFLLLLFIL